MPKMVLYIDYEPNEIGGSKGRQIPSERLTPQVINNPFSAKAGSAWLDSKYTDTQGADSIGQIMIRRDNGELEPVTALAHEIGHVIAQWMGLPAAMADRKAGEQPFSQIFGKPRDILINAEKEAWKVAHKLGLPMDAATEKMAIESYEKNS